MRVLDGVRREENAGTYRNDIGLRYADGESESVLGKKIVNCIN